MSAARWTAATRDELVGLVTGGHTNAQIATAYGVSVKAVERRLAGLGIQRDPATLRALLRHGVAPVAVEGDAAREASSLANRPLSGEEIARLWSIDLAVWEAESIAPNTWGIGAKHPVTGEILTKPLFQTKVRFVRKATPSLERLRDELLDGMRRESKRRRRLTPKRLTLPSGSDACALEVDLFDLHVGKYAWAEETGTGQNYDSDIAEQVATAAVTDLVSQVPPSCALEEIILPIGNDWYHVDNPQGQTNAGTPQDRDSRYQRMFRIGHGIASWMIERCAELAPVRVIIVPGNHDTATAFCLGVVLEAEFAHDRRVSFDNSPRTRKYHQYGKVLLGYTHGHEEKPDHYARLMPVEEPEKWAQTSCREFHLGHFHTGKQREPLIVEDKVGVTVRWMRSLAGTDAWHASKGYLGIRSAEAFLWRRAGGLRAHLVSRPVDELLALRVDRQVRRTKAPARQAARRAAR